jgi:hypothetical protein
MLFYYAYFIRGVEAAVGYEVKMTPSNSPNVSAAAERMRRHRQRGRDGLRCLRIELRKTEIDELVRRKFLAPETRNDRSAILRAFYYFLDHALAGGW